jgi:N-acyl-D-amino-acid deacylase
MRKDCNARSVAVTLYRAGSALRLNAIAGRRRTSMPSLASSRCPLLFLVALALAHAFAVGTAVLAKDPSAAALRDAVARGLAVVEKAARNYPEHRKCFSCHHQTLPALAMATAAERGLDADRALLENVIEFSHESFRSRAERMRQGEDIGGAAMTVGYGLWTLAIGRRERDDTTAAMVEFLLKDQEDDGRWQRFTSRPPLEDSDFTATALAIYYAQKFADDSQRERVKAAAERGAAWLLRATAASQEDKNSLLGGLRLAGAPADRIEAARKAVLDAQQDDGGWAQLPGMASDAYATGQTLFTLQRVGLAPSDPAYRRGVEFLLRSQREDGSWLVESRSKPIQTFFDNGDPHGKHQFISTPATAWAVTALALALESPTRRRL